MKKGLLILISIIASVLILYFCGYFIVYLSYRLRDFYEIYEVIKDLLLVLVPVGAILTYKVFNGKIDNSLTDNISNFKTEREEIKKKQDKSVFDVVNLNLSQLNEYYTINIIQSKKSFLFSVYTISAGLVFITFGVLYAIVTEEIDLLTYITSIFGLISSYVGGTSLRLYNISVKNMNDFFDKLSELQKIMVAIELSNSLEDEEKHKSISKLIENLTKV
ncbi:hypothetical protein RJG79_10695 [Mycoplasmatota bacterium WC44]